MPRGKQRIQPPGVETPQLRPQASPVDTFVRPQGSNLSSLAEGLARFAPSLARYSDVLAERDKEQAVLEGNAMARQLAEERKTYKDAVKAGLPVHKNPWFAYAMKEQLGRVSAGSYGNALKQEAMGWVEQGAAPDDYAKLEGEFRQKWVEENVGKDNRDLHFERGFALVDAYSQDTANAFISAAGARMQKDAAVLHGTELNQILDQNFGKLPDDDVVALLNATNARYLADNPKAGRIANVATIQALVNYATLNATKGGDKALDLAEKLSAGPGAKLISTPEARAAIVEARQEVMRIRTQDFNIKAAEEERTEKVAERAIWSDLSKALMETSDATTFDVAPYLARMREVDPSDTMMSRVIGLRESFIRKDASGDEETFKEAIARVHGVDPEHPGSLTMRQLVNLADRKTMGTRALSASQFGQLANMIEARNSAGSGGGENAGSKLLNDNIYQHGVAFIKQSMLDAYGSNSPETRVAAAQAVRDYTQTYLNGVAALPTDPSKRFDAAQKLAEQAMLTRATPQVQKTLTKSENKQQQVRQKNTAIYEEGIKKLLPADQNNLQRLYDDYFALKKDPSKKLSKESERLLIKLGLDRAGLDAFLRAWAENR